MSLISTQSNFGGRQPTNTSYVKQFVESPIATVMNWIYQTISGVTYIAPSVTTYPILIPQSMVIDGNLTVYGVFSNPSDERIKRDIIDIDPNVAQRVHELRPRQYRLRREGADGPTHYGLVAQEVERLYPELVSALEDGTKAVNYIELVPILLAQLQDMALDIRDHREQLAALERRLTYGAPTNW